MSLTLAFDIGYASIGWCVISSENKSQTDPQFLGTGVVTFRSDDCLASTRRDLRRTRRHIRSTRQRIERLKKWLVHRNVLTRAELDLPGHPAPFLLAAAALQGHRTLTTLELWTVLRWYAHNRGYDGNSRWARNQQNDEDTEKESNACSLMKEHGTETMAETVCACLGLSPSDHDQRISSALPYKPLNAAYPREIVEKEVSQLLNVHLDQLEGLDASTVRPMLTSNTLKSADRERIKAAEIPLPRRYHGGLLFGQLVPRFDNRIISRCPITWAKTYDDSIAEGKTDVEATKLADKFAKVPTAKSPDFLKFRFAMLLANLKIDDAKPLPAPLRKRLWDLAHDQGRLTHRDLAREIKDAGFTPYNLEATFKIHPDSEDALILDPAIAFKSQNQIIKTIWSTLPQPTQKLALRRWQRGQTIKLGELYDHSGMKADVMTAIESALAASQKRSRSKSSGITLDSFLLQSVGPKKITGRAPYARPVLQQVVTEILAGHHPSKANQSTDPNNGEEKAENGALYDLAIPTSRVRQLQAERPMDQLTNNHLVRHRMLILGRLVDDILKKFRTDGSEFSQVVVEVARELKEFSGMDNQKLKKALGAKLAQHKAAEARLIRHGISPTYQMIRKCRIAMDLNWTCPFTHRRYSEAELEDLEYEHIIPRSQRASDSMSGLVLTRKEINSWKGQRTGLQFVTEEALDDRIVSPALYKKWVDKLKVANKDRFPDDHHRQMARKRLLHVEEYSGKERTFTEGQLTQSSQLMKYAMGIVKERIPSSNVDPIPGPVTAEIRKSWKLTGALSLACPEVLDEKGDVRVKNEIRGLTHLHHALDAATLAMAAHYFPLRQRGQNQSGKIWQALMKRRRSEAEKNFLHSLGIFATYQRPSRDRKTQETDVRLRDLSAEIKNALARSLAECRVMQHVPSDRSGAKAELTTWGVVGIEGEGENARVSLQQRSTSVEDGMRKFKYKTREERAGKLLGVNPKNGQGKLKAIDGAMIIGENYGLALDPEPTIIPFHDVPARLAKLRAANGGKPIRILRNGTVISYSLKERIELWVIRSIQLSRVKGYLLDLSRPGMIPYRERAKSWCRRDVNVKVLLRSGLEILPRRYTGYPITDQ